eukprot:SAG22_NODE_3314_length_1784_cov_7.240950_2_plen_111_part_00
MPFLARLSATGCLLAPEDREGVTPGRLAETAGHAAVLKVLKQVEFDRDMGFAVPDEVRSRTRTWDILTPSQTFPPRFASWTLRLSTQDEAVGYLRQQLRDLQARAVHRES